MVRNLSDYATNQDLASQNVPTSLLIGITSGLPVSQGLVVRFTSDAVYLGGLWVS